MTTKRASKPKTVKVTFSLPPEIEAEVIALCGEFNDWSSDDVKLARDPQGRWRTTISLEPGRSYRYRYLLDGCRWENNGTLTTTSPTPMAETTRSSLSRRHGSRFTSSIASAWRPDRPRPGR